MLDQVSSLRECSISAGILTGHAAVSEQFTVESCIIERYSSCPEAIIGMERWREASLKAPLSECIVAVAVDEAHCVSKW